MAFGLERKAGGADDSGRIKTPHHTESALDRGETRTPAPVVRLSEDWLALCIGLLLFGIALLGLTGIEPFGWGIKTNVWLAAGKIMTPVSAKFSSLPGWVSLGLTWTVMAAVLGTGAWLLGARPARFLAGFTIVFLASYFC